MKFILKQRKIKTNEMKSIKKEKNKRKIKTNGIKSKKKKKMRAKNSFEKKISFENKNCFGKKIIAFPKKKFFNVYLKF